MGADHGMFLESWHFASGNLGLGDRGRAKSSAELKLLSVKPEIVARNVNEQVSNPLAEANGRSTLVR
jgi:hypothetical protein